MAKSTSFRISDDAKRRLTEQAALEGIDTLEHPGIVFRGPAHARRAALAAGPDVWEIVGRLQELEGSLQERIRTLTEETDLHERSIRIAVDYAAEHAEEIQARIDVNRRMAERLSRVAEARETSSRDRVPSRRDIPAGCGRPFRDAHGHDAIQVTEVGLRSATDAQVATVARAQGRVLVTENVPDCAMERDLVVVCVLRKNLPSGGALASALAKVLDAWARANPEPYPGMHWPTVS